jgi:hypothetical protein
LGRTVAQAFDYFQGELELKDGSADVAEARHKFIRCAIEDALPSVRTQLIGSFGRHTKIRPLEDIDILVEIGEFTGFSDGGITTDQALQWLQNVLENHQIYGRMDIHCDHPCVVLEYQDGMRVEIVPAYRDKTGQVSPIGRAYWVPVKLGWSLADYDYNAAYVSNLNQNSTVNGRLVPFIKMLKAWRREHQLTVSSLYLEALAADTVHSILFNWDTFTPFSYKTLSARFFQQSRFTPYQPVRIPGSLDEKPPDAHLAQNAKARVVRLLSDASKKANDAINAERFFGDAQAISMWNSIFGYPFPKD